MILDLRSHSLNQVRVIRHLQKLIMRCQKAFVGALMLAPLSPALEMSITYNKVCWRRLDITMRFLASTAKL
jgi:hypothetical protein